MRICVLIFAFLFERISGQGIFNRIRLADGIAEGEGRVEIFFNNEWSTICNTNFRIEEGHVICQQLDYVGLVWLDSFGPGTGQILQSGGTCNGGEVSILDCDLNSDNSVGDTICNHDLDAGVVCKVRDWEHSVRLVGGNSIAEGRVEFYDNQWWTPCSDDLNEDTARVICIDLGFITAKAYNSLTVNSADSRSGFYYYCTTYDFTLEDCLQMFFSYSCFSPGASVVCQTGQSNSYDIRLVNGFSEGQGRIEVLSANAWKTVSVSEFGINEGRVACQQLGYIELIELTFFGSGTGTQGCIASLVCSGGEESLMDCSLVEFSSTCIHLYDVGVVCKVPDPENSVRLVGGYSVSEGRVEYYYHKRWLTPCAVDVSQNIANVICRQMGYLIATSYNSLTSYAVGNGINGGMKLSYICYSTDTTLSDCSDFSFSASTCSAPSTSVECGDVTEVTIGGVIAFIVIVIMIGLCVCGCCAVCCRSSSRRRSTQATTSNVVVTNAPNVPSTVVHPPPGHQMYPVQQMPLQPVVLPPPPYDAVQPPPSQTYPAPPPGQGYPQAPGYPPAQGPGYPPAEGPGYPPAQGPGYPPAQGPGYPPAQGPGYPPAQAQGYPPAQAPGYPPAQAPGYPPPSASQPEMIQQTPADPSAPPLYI